MSRKKRSPQSSGKERYSPTPSDPFLDRLHDTYASHSLPSHVEKKTDLFAPSTVFASSQQHLEQLRQVGVSQEPEQINEAYDQLRGRKSISGSAAVGLLGLPRVGNSCREE